MKINLTNGFESKIQFYFWTVGTDRAKGQMGTERHQSIEETLEKQRQGMRASGLTQRQAQRVAHELDKLPRISHLILSP